MLSLSKPFPKDKAVGWGRHRFSRRVFISVIPLGLASCAALDPRKVQITDLPQETIQPKLTSFTTVLRDLGKMTETYNTRRLNLLSLPIGDDTGVSAAPGAEIPRDITEMVKTALNAIGGRLTFIPYNPIVSQNLAVLYPQETISRQVPHAYISGGITEFDRGLEILESTLDIGGETEIYSLPLGVEYSNAKTTSAARVTLDFNMFAFPQETGIPRMQTANTVVVYKALKERELGLTLFGPTFGLRGVIKKIQGRHAVVRLLVQLSMIQLVGCYLTLPFWRLLPDGQPDPVVMDALRANFHRMRVRERLVEIQRLLALHGYKVVQNGRVDEQTRAALRRLGRYRSDADCISEEVFLDLYVSVPL